MQLELNNKFVETLITVNIKMSNFRNYFQITGLKKYYCFKQPCYTKRIKIDLCKMRRHQINDVSGTPETNFLYKLFISAACKERKKMNGWAKSQDSYLQAGNRL